MNEATSLLGSRDPQWRDDVGYGVVAACVYQARRLSAAERRALIETLTANLQRGIGETGTDSVLLRSFSALDLSLLAALELIDPALDDDGYRRLLDRALTYLHDERDLRGLQPGIGWIHATAHTADLLKFLARDPRFTLADQHRLLEAAWARMTGPGIPVWTHAEEERLAAALLSVVRRKDFDAATLEPWLARFVNARTAGLDPGSAGCGATGSVAERTPPAAELLRAAVAAAARTHAGSTHDAPAGAGHPAKHPALSMRERTGRSGERRQARN